MQTTQRSNAPCGMVRGSAAADADHNTIYVTPRGSSSIYRYHVENDVWKRLPSAPYQDSGLVIRDNTLVAIGGQETSFRAVKRLFSLRGKKWREDLPPMINVHSKPAVATHSTYVFVIGGFVNELETTPIAFVEMLDQHNTWTLLNNLPCPLGLPSATVCGSTLHVISGYSDGDGYSCSINHIVSSDHHIVSSDHQKGSPPALTWKPMPQPPVIWSTAISLSKKLLLVGGTVRDTHTDSSALYVLSHGQWMKSGSLSSGRRKCLVASLSEEVVLVVGGTFLSSVDLCMAI